MAGSAHYLGPTPTGLAFGHIKALIHPGPFDGGALQVVSFE